MACSKEAADPIEIAAVCLACKQKEGEVDKDSESKFGLII